VEGWTGIEKLVANNTERIDQDHEALVRAALRFRRLVPRGGYARAV
jgi:hypothetical protein